jgi:hypothetical protein
MGTLGGRLGTRKSVAAKSCLKVLRPVTGDCLANFAQTETIPEFLSGKRLVNFRINRSRFSKLDSMKMRNKMGSALGLNRWCTGFNAERLVFIKTQPEKSEGYLDIQSIATMDPNDNETRKQRGLVCPELTRSARTFSKSLFKNSVISGIEAGVFNW